MIKAVLLLTAKPEVVHISISRWLDKQTGVYPDNERIGWGTDETWMAKSWCMLKLDERYVGVDYTILFTSYEFENFHNKYF